MPRKKRAGQERQHVEQEIAEQPPFLRRVGDEEDGVERDLLREELAATVSGPNSISDGRGDAAPMALEPVLARRT